MDAKKALELSKAAIEKQIEEYYKSKNYETVIQKIKEATDKGEMCAIVDDCIVLEKALVKKGFFVSKPTDTYNNINKLVIDWRACN